MHDSALLVTDVSKTFGHNGHRRWPWSNRAKAPKVVRAVDRVSFEVARHEIFGVLGANGSGKSTLIRLISTLLVPDSGAVGVFGHDVLREERAVKRLISRVSVDAAFFKKLSPMENLIYTARLYGLEPRPAREKALAIMARLGINRQQAYEPMDKMSRGMQQKVAIARAFLTSPVLLLLDEPTTGLDPRSKRDVQKFVRELRDEHDATIVLTTHDMDEADRLCDRIAVLDQGKVVALDTCGGLKRLCAERTGATDPAAVTMEDVFMDMTGRETLDGLAYADEPAPEG